VSQWQCKKCDCRFDSDQPRTYCILCREIIRKRRALVAFIFFLLFIIALLWVMFKNPV